MGADWIKMRTDIYRDPKVCLIADALLDQEGALAAYVNQNTRSNMAVTRNVTRCATVGALVTLWGVTRQRGRRHGDDLVIPGATLEVIDDIADLPGLGEAMNLVGWARVDEAIGLVLPNFFGEFNVEPSRATAKSGAERQRRYREKLAKRDETLRNGDVTRNASRDGRVREREELNTHTHTPHACARDGFPKELNTDAFLLEWDQWVAYLPKVTDKPRAVPEILEAQLREIYQFVKSGRSIDAAIEALQRGRSVGAKRPAWDDFSKRAPPPAAIVESKQDKKPRKRDIF